MRKLLVVTFAAAALTGSALVIGADAASDNPPSATGEMRNFMLDAHLAGMKAALRLTPEQESKWQAFESTVRDAAKTYVEERRAMREEMRDETPNPIERLNMLSERLGRGSAGLKTIADAAKPLYDSLDDTQKRHFGPLLMSLRPHERHGGGMMMDHERHHDEDEEE
ncbi:MAG TPA: Spy/CpxP family protein refolding chaperone [Roseiarcus sp.]